MLNINKLKVAIKWSFISDHFFFQEGPGVRSVQYTDVGVKLLNVGNLEKNKLILENTERRISYETASNEYKHFMVDEGDLLIACSGIAARYFDEKIAFARSEHLPLCMNTSTMRFKAKSKHVLLEYLYHYLRTHRFKKEIAMVLTGSAQFNFGPSHVEKLKFPLIEIIDQRNISFFLSAFDRLIEKQKEKVDRIKAMKKGYLQKMFPADGEKEPEIRLKGFNAPWKSKKLGEMGFFISDGNYGSLYPKSNQFVKTGVPFLRVNNMRDGYLVDDDLVFISADLNKILTSGHLLNNDILITNRGEIGLIAYVNKKYEGSNINAQICLIRTLNKLDSKYLHQFLQTQYAQSQLQSLQTGSALKQLPRKRLDDLIILRPIDNGEDTKIGSFLSAIDRLIEKEEAAIERYESLKKGYLQKIFAD
jgi:type I restriction enzyme S subunit